MRSLIATAFVVLLISSISVAQQPIRLSGTITDAKTHEALPRASVAVLGTKRGSIANSDGYYSLPVEAGTTVRLRIASLGYRPDTITVSISTATKRDIALTPFPAELETVVVTSDASRDQARRIMHEVIRRKNRWRDHLNNYKCSAYSRWNMRSINGGDTTVRSVAESNADGYWDKELGLYEVVTSRRQTANFPAQANIFSIGEIMNFYDDRIDFDDFALTTPVADDAFSSYDFDLIGTATVGNAPVWKIRLYPGIASTAFDGVVWIDQLDYSIAYLDLTPSGAVKLGPLKDIRLEQSFDLFRDTFWMPVNLHSQVTIKLDIPFVPQFKLELLTLMKDYTINTIIPDSIFTGKRHRAAPDADSTDNAAFDETRPIPLATDEAKAYTTIDSAVTARHSDSAGGGINALDLLTLIDIPRYNQIEGFRFGLSKSITPFDSWPVSLGATVAYGLKDKLFKYSVGLRQGLIWTTEKHSVFSGSLSGEFSGEYKDVPEVALWVSAAYFDDMGHFGDAYSNLENSIMSLLYKTDYQGIFHNKGYRVGLSSDVLAGVNIDLTYTRMDMWDGDSVHFVNPYESSQRHPNGTLSLTLSRGFNLLGFDFGANANISSSSAALGSEYTFTTLASDLSASKRLGGWGVLDIIGRFQTTFAGSLPGWNLLFFETRNQFLSKFKYLRGWKPFEFMGDRIWSVNLEHNFYDLPTRMLGLHFLDPLNLQWRVHAAVAATSITRVGTTAAPTTGDTPYTEVGFGVGNIVHIINLEATWRLDHKTGSDFYPTLALELTF